MTFSQRVVSITQDTILPKVYDNILSDNFATFRYIANGKKWVGETLKRPVKLSKNSNGGSFSGLDVHSTAAVETRQTMSYDLRGFEMPVAIPGMDRLVNQSEAQVIDLIKVEAESSAIDALDAIGDIFYDDGTGNDSKDFNGLDNLNDDGTTATTVGGLSRTTYVSLKGTRTASGGVMNINKLGSVYSGAAGGSAMKQRPTIMQSSETEWNLYEQLLSPTVRANYEAGGYPMVTRKSRGVVAQGNLNGALGYTSLVFRATPWVGDEKAPTQTVWFNNENYLEWYGAKDAEMEQVDLGQTHEGVYDEMPSKNTGLQFSGFMKPVNQYGVIGHIYLLGNLVTFQPRRHGRLTGVTSV